MLKQCREIVRKFNEVYGETLIEPKIVLPSNQACLRLPEVAEILKEGTENGFVVITTE